MLQELFEINYFNLYEHADIHADEKRWYVRVECNGFATVTFDQTTKESVTTFGSGTHLTVQEDCTYKVTTTALISHIKSDARSNN